MKRAFDVVGSFALLLLLAIPMLLIAIAVRASSKGPAIYWSTRVGYRNKLFRMPKFRSMYVGTPAVATHLLSDPGSFITPLGRFLRASSLDELPQLFSVLSGCMSMVGPRPALFNQHDLIAARTAVGVHELKPGITGWAQVNGRDEIPIEEKVALDAEYLRRRSIWMDMQVLCLTVIKTARREGISH